MLERGLVSRILFPAPVPTYSADSYPEELVWVPKGQSAGSTSPPPLDEDSVPCLLLTYPSARFLIIFFHSNAEDLGRCRGFCCYLREQFQVHVLAVEYPGYGICPGIPTGESVMDNAFAALQFATDTLGWPLDSIKVFGRSIGTGPTVGLASRFSFAGVILVTPFLSVQELFRDRVGPFAGLIEEWFANRDGAPKISSPTMIIHGQRDELIHCRHGESIYELLRTRKLMISPVDMEHNTNLLENLQFFVLPMFQFFALPDYVFQDMKVPTWAYDRRRSPFYRESDDSSAAMPTAEQAKPRAASAPRKPIADYASVAGVTGKNRPRSTSPSSTAHRRRAAAPAAYRAVAAAKLRAEAAQATGPHPQLVPLLSQPKPHAGPEAPAHPESASPGSVSVADEPAQSPQAEPNEPNSDSEQKQEVIRRLAEFAGDMCVGEICSDQLVQDSDLERPRRAPPAPESPAPRRAAVPTATILPTPRVEDSVWSRWCGTGRTLLTIDLHETGEDSRIWTRPITRQCCHQPPHLMISACCRGGAFAAEAVKPDLMSPKPARCSMLPTDEELLEHLGPSLKPPKRKRCAISI
mmetsp:Transcript_23202/g.54317  ORF Transcript_23202/g.54317 Transcript_23202/m.54317 type:complete len:580 (-) Transcript_23202:118-1857(-)